MSVTTSSDRAERARTLADQLDASERCLLALDEPDAGQAIARLHHCEVLSLRPLVRRRRWELLLALSDLAARELEDDRRQDRDSR